MSERTICKRIKTARKPNILGQKLPRRLIKKSSNNKQSNRSSQENILKHNILNTRAKNMSKVKIRNRGSNSSSKTNVNFQSFASTKQFYKLSQFKSSFMQNKTFRKNFDKRKTLKKSNSNSNFTHADKSKRFKKSKESNKFGSQIISFNETNTNSDALIDKSSTSKFAYDQ